MNDKLCSAITPIFTRRDMLRLTGCGFGAIAFTSIAAEAARAEGPLDPKQPHFTPKAKRVIFLCMRGGPSHVDTFDYKPKLIEDTGKPGPRNGTKLFGSQFSFKQYGKGGLWISELFPELAKHADKLCMIPSMQTDLPAHPQAMVKLHTGNSQFVRPSLGAWSLYGLGTENQNLPGFVSITPPTGFGGAGNYGSSFLPAIYQGTRVGNDNRSVTRAELPNLKPNQKPADQRAELDFLQSLNKDKAKRDQVAPEVEGIIESYELAFRMQTEMPGVMDMSKESPTVQKLYGIGQQPTDDMGRKCLLARRMIESGVRFVEITHGNWDHHNNLTTALPRNCEQIDKPISGLLQDLAQRKLLDDTLVIWTGEFGRTPFAEGVEGRDHNNKAFTMWMAGGGVKGGFQYGKSDEYGFEAVENPVSIHDFHATVLYALGLDHEKLTYSHAGRAFRLTDVHGIVAKGIFA